MSLRIGSGAGVRRRPAASGRGRAGRRGEAAAVRHLRRQGYRIVGRNVQTRVGEIDVLARTPDGSRLVIVEVKASGADAAGPSPESRVGAAKRRKLIQLAGALLRQPGFAGSAVRIDICGVDLPPASWRAWLGLTRATVRHFPDAVRV